MPSFGARHLFVVLLLGATSLLCWLVLTAPRHQSIVPEGTPDESNRISHEGFSVIIPKGWHGQVLGPPGATIQATPSWPTKYPTSIIRIDRIDFLSMKDIAHAQTTTFQGREALLVERHFRREHQWDDPDITVSQFEIFTERASATYRLVFSTNLAMDVLPASVSRHLETFQVNTEVGPNRD